MRKKFLGCALATALSVLGLVGCGAGDTETVTSADSAAEVQVSDKTETEETDAAQKEITWATWGNEGELKRFEALNEAFMEANPDVKVNFIPIPNNGYSDKLLAMIASGTEPDLYYVADGNYHSLALGGKLEPLPGLDEATFMNEALPEHKEVWQKYRAEGVRGYVEDSLHPETANVLSDAEDEMFANFADVQTTLQSLQDQINQIVSQ